jgi:putative pyruvate formate lyase activating enzyme
MLELEYGCQLCPRRCGTLAQSKRPGRCQVSRIADVYRVARLMAHAWEEPFISGRRGSGTVFFSGCSLGCLFCQNHVISQSGQGQTLDQDQLISAILELAGQGVHNLNLVTASHYADRLPRLLARLRSEPLSRFGRCR